MRTIQHIYNDYKLPHNLQIHQIRVAAVGMYLSKAHNLTDTACVIQACLLHDMGNIIKYTFDGILKLDNEEALKAVKQQFIQKYGDNEHTATDMICREIGVDNRTLELVNKVGADYGTDIVEGNDMSKKIRWYSDWRVLPHKIGTLQERLDDFDVRYKERIGDDIARIERHKQRIIQIREVEKQIFTALSITPEMITDSFLEPSINDLWHYTL